MDSEQLAAAKADLEIALGHRLAGLEWGSRPMARAIDRYLFGDLTKQTAAGFVAAIAPAGALAPILRRVGAELARPAATQLAALRWLSDTELQELIGRAWTRGNRGLRPPEGTGYVSFAAEAVLTAARRTTAPL